MGRAIGNKKPPPTHAGGGCCPRGTHHALWSGHGHVTAPRRVQACLRAPHGHPRLRRSGTAV